MMTLAVPNSFHYINNILQHIQSMDDDPAAIQARLAAHADRLSSGELDGNPKARKRIMQKIGDCRRKLAALGGTNDEHDGEKVSPSDKGEGDPPAKRAKVDPEGQRTRLAELLSAGTGTIVSSAATSGGGGGGGAAVGGDEGEAPQSKRAMKRASAEEKQKRKKKTLHLNRQLGDLAQRKQLNDAKKAFRRGTRQSLTDVHSFTNLINAHVRCYDIAGARCVMVNGVVVSVWFSFPRFWHSLDTARAALLVRVLL
jgi:hypothetical protein